MNKLTRWLTVLATAAALGAAMYAHAQQIMEMTGAVLIDGYDFQNDVGPKGSIAYDPDSNEFYGGFRGLKIPEGQTAVFAWLHDTVNQSSTLVGPVTSITAGTANSGKFTIKAPEELAGGNFGSHEIIGFTAESSELMQDGNAVASPETPAGSEKVDPPAFYLFAALPGADTERHFCGHGKDFFYAKAPEKQTCYDCICRQKYSACIKAGKGYHNIKS